MTDADLAKARECPLPLTGIRDRSDAGMAVRAIEEQEAREWIAAALAAARAEGFAAGLERAARFADRWCEKPGIAADICALQPEPKGGDDAA